MKKILAMVLALVMMIGCLAGCGEQTVETEALTKAPETEAATKAPETDAPTEAPTEAEESDWLGTEDGKTITLRLWAGVQPEYGYDEMVKNFNEEYKDRGLQMEYVRYVNDTNGNLQLETYLMSGGEVDVFIGYGGKANLDKRKESNLLYDMSDMLAERGFDLVKELGESNMASYTYDDGSCVGFPTKYENAKWILINVDMFKEAGLEIPYDGWTYSEFLTACEKLTKGEGQDKVYAIHYTLKQAGTQLTGILASVLQGYNLCNADATKVTFDDPVWRTGLEMVKTTLDNGWAIPIEDDYSENMTVANTYLAGKCAMTTNVSQMRLVMDTVTYPHDFVTALVPGPIPDDAEYQTETLRTHATAAGAGDVISIAANTEYPEQCFELVMWYIQGGMAALAKGGRIPLWTGIEKQKVIDVLTANANGSIDLDSMNNYLSIDNTQSVPYVNPSCAAELKAVLKEEFEAMCYGRQSVDDTINNLVTRGNELLANAQ